MTHCTRTGIVLLLLVQGLVGCGGSESRTLPSASRTLPSAPSPVPQPVAPNQLIVFKDPLTGLSTSDVRDAQDYIVQFTTARELVWTADGTHLPGHVVQGPGYQPGGNYAGEPSCQCWLVVRFGASNGERRAYLTADYIHFNPGTLVALDVVGGAVIVSRTSVFPPGTYTLSGIVTEATENGLMPIENVNVYRLDEEASGWDQTTTDPNGFYEIHGLSDGSRLIGFSKEGYQKVEQADFSIHGDLRFDIQLIRR
jgi:Carboxypeptidase regulatory-like domain